MYLRFLVQAFFLFLCLLCSMNKSHAEQPEAQLSDSHIVKVTSLLPPTVCNRNSTKVPSKASLEVVSRYGPCSYINKDKVKALNYSEILRKDRARAKYIQSRLFKLKHSGSDDDHSKETEAFSVGTKPIKASGTSIEFYIPASLGTPGQKVNLLLDTGSDITWTQITPCLKCFKQKTPYLIHPNPPRFLLFHAGHQPVYQISTQFAIMKTSASTIPHTAVAVPLAL
ncbi:aspartyl protease family protein At5g10770-like [Mangifera indica]|uniref:aspartyl protease family protein At5g10770-like n=1 Tax=Mangifera indica TaxID=29780 RepID=UPI001CF9C73E|nr:aspartyl protease family protein At5g10770-like [Mangifera indica]